MPATSGESRGQRQVLRYREAQIQHNQCRRPAGGKINPFLTVRRFDHAQVWRRLFVFQAEPDKGRVGVQRVAHESSDLRLDLDEEQGCGIVKHRRMMLRRGSAAWPSARFFMGFL